MGRTGARGRAWGLAGRKGFPVRADPRCSALCCAVLCHAMSCRAVPCRAAADAEREKASAGMGANTRHLSARRAGAGGRSPGSTRFPSEEGEEEEEEDYDKLN